MKPSNVPTGRVTGRFIIGVEDGPDPDDEPDYIAAKGIIELQMSVPYIPNPTADPVPVTMLNARRRLVLDAEGYACTPNADGTAGVRDMRLEADGSPDALVSGWTWNVTYRFDPVNGSAPSIPAHSFVMLPGAVVDLTTVVRVPSSPGYGLPQSEAAVLRAEGAAVESAQNALEARQASDTIIEMTETGRLSETALSDTIGELSGPVIDAKVAPVMATAQDVVDRANAGEFDGADGAPGNATMRVDTTVGTRIFITDGVTEHMISGDTSRRNVVDLLVNGWSVVATQNPILRREGNTVTLRAYLGRGSDPLALTVPAGFRASAIHVQGAFYGLGTPANQVGVEISSSGTVRLLGANALNTTHYCYWRWETHDAWPTSLPGTPA